MAFKLAIIDGTGAWFDSTYASEMKHSFCHQMYESAKGNAFYQRGPSFDGLADAFKMNDAVTWLMKQREADPKVKLMVAGYSRGAAVAIAVAERLQEEGARVHSLFLFDAVARHVLAYGRSIPQNVDYCRHAMRSQDPRFVDKYEPKRSTRIGQILAYPVTSNPTRPFFGNVGKQADKRVDYQTKTFLGSHGALGGVGWKKVTEDIAAQLAVAAWMNRWINDRGLPTVLTPSAPSSE